MKGFIGADRDQCTLMPYDIEDWIPENHLARFVIELVDKLDFQSVYNSYKGVGSMPYDPKMLLSLLFYGYSTGVFSSRKIEKSTYDSVAFRFIAGNNHPDHDTISSFRKRFLPKIQEWFKEILLIGKELNLVKLGNIYIDGTKVQANASRHKAMSYEYIQKLEKQLDTEITKLLELANSKDEEEVDLELDIPKEIELRETRLKKIKEAKEVIKQRATDRYKKEKAEYDKKMEVRAEKEKQTGKKQKGRAPKVPSDQPNQKDQYNFTDPESRIMKTPNGFDQCYNGQAAVNEDMLIVGAYSTVNGNDKQEFIPAINSIPEEFRPYITTAVADTGYFSEKNIDDCKNDKETNITPLISTARQKHNTFLEDKLKEEINPEKCTTPVEKMNLALQGEGKEIYKKRKQTVEPVFGIIKEILGFRRFSLRSEKKSNAEWSLVCTAYNIKRMFKLSLA